MLTQIFLSASATVAANSKVEMVTPDLQNPFRTAMLLDEIRVYSDLGAYTEARFALGREPLTSGFVPATALGRFLNPGGATTYSTWKLPKPLYVPPGEFVVPTIYNRPSSGSVSANVKVEYAGRSLGSGTKPPEIVHMPWISSWRTQAAGDQLVDFESSEVELRNPFNGELKVQRFLGRVFVNSTENTDILARQDILVRITDSAGRFLVRDPTPFADLFFINERAWDVNAMLRPKGFYTVNLACDYTERLTSEQISTVISCVGYRDVFLNS